MNIFETIKENHNLITDDDNNIIIKPLSKYDYATNPERLVGCICITLNEFLRLRSGKLRFTDDLTGLEVNDDE